MTNRTNVGGWLQGKTVRKGGITSSKEHTGRSGTPQVQSTSATIFGGGVKDVSGRVAEYFVCTSSQLLKSAVHIYEPYSQWTIFVLYASPIGT